MSKTKTTRYDVAEHLRTPKEMAAYLEASFEEANGDAAFIAKALGDIARAKGMAQVARDSGLSRESLNEALSGERSPDFDTILKLVGALGLKLHVEAAHGPADPDADWCGTSFDKTSIANVLTRAIPAQNSNFIANDAVGDDVTGPGYRMTVHAAGCGRGAESGLRADQRD